jgi:hypothetical protein
MGSTEQEVPSRDSTPDFAAAHARRRRSRNVIIGALLLLGGGAITAAFLVSSRRARDELALAAGQLRGCLFVKPIENGESSLLRFRRLQLAAASRSDFDRLAATRRIWPERCRDSITKVRELLKTDATQEQLETFVKLNKVLGDATMVAGDVTHVLTPVTALIDERAPGSIPETGEPLPPLARNLDSLSAIPPLSKRGTALGSSYTEDNPGLSLPVLVDDESLTAPLLCSFRAAATAAECRAMTELTSVHGHGLRLLGTSDEASQTIVFAGKRGSAGIFVSGSADPVDRVYSYGGYAAKDGTVSVLGWDTEQRHMVLVRSAPGRAPVRTPLKPNFRVGNYFYSSQLLWDQVLVRGVTPDNERRLFVLSLASPDARSFALADIGELPEAGLIRDGEEEQPHLTGCRTSAATVVRVRGTAHDSLTFRVADKFSQPVQAPTWGTLGCHASAATFVKAGFATSGTRLYHATCTTAGCNTSALKSDALDRNSSELRPQDQRDVQAVDLAGKLLVVWLAGARAGLRMRLARADVFAREPDTLLFDDHVQSGKYVDTSTLLGFRLYSRERFAVLLLSSMAGVHAFRIDPDGNVTPFAVRGGG